MEEDILEQELSETKKPKKKLWVIIIIIGILGLGYYGYTIVGNPFAKEENSTSIDSRTFEQIVCSQIKVTPTWINREGIVDEGYSNFENIAPRTAVNLLINANVTFVYDSDCDSCKDQIGYFGSEWERYVNSGYTLNCKDV